MGGVLGEDRRERRRRGGKGAEIRVTEGRAPILIKNYNNFFFGGSSIHRTPEAIRAFRITVSFTTANTSRMFEVSVACVRLWGEGQITNGIELR